MEGKSNYEKIISAWPEVSALEVGDFTTRDFDVDSLCESEEDTALRITGMDKWENVYDLGFTVEDINNGTFDEETGILSASDREGYDYEIIPLVRKSLK